MDPLDAYRTWLTRQPAHTRPLLLAAVALIPILALTAIVVLLPALAPLGGTVAGLGLFAAAYGYTATMASPELRDRLDLTLRYPLGTRRTQVAVAAVAWVLLILLIGRYAPAPLLGTLTVFVALCLLLSARPTPEEAAHIRAEAAARAAQAEAEAIASENYDYDADFEGDPYDDEGYDEESPR